MSYDFFSFPMSRYSDFPTVGTYVVINGRHLWRIVPELFTPGITYIHVDRISESVQFPYTGNRHCIPSFVIKLWVPEINRAGIGIGHPIKFPSSIQSHEIG